MTQQFPWDPDPVSYTHLDVYKRQADAISEAVPAGQVIATLVGFFAVYALIYIAWIRSVVKTVKKGPDVYLSGSEGRNGEAPAVSDGGRAAQGSAAAAKEVGTRCCLLYTSRCV